MIEMKRKFLEDLGLEKEQIDKILDENSQDIGKAKGDLEDVQEKLKTAESEIETLKSQAKDRDDQLETLKNSTGDVESLKEQIQTLQNDNKTKDEAHAAEIKQLKIDSAVEKALSLAKVKNSVAVKALLKDMDKAELDEDGTIKGLSEQIEALQKSDAYLFEAKETKPALKGVEPGQGKDPDFKGLTKEQFNKMSYKEKVNLFNENKELYDSLAK
jgi:septal ring factor EnvC (AmiA/AmiB activator)